MIFPPITNTSIHQPHRHSHLKSIGVHYQGAEDTSLLKIFPWSPTYIEQDFPLPSQLSHWDKDQSFFISSSRHHQPQKPHASAYNEVTTEEKKKIILGQASATTFQPNFSKTLFFTILISQSHIS